MSLPREKEKEIKNKDYLSVILLKVFAFIRVGDAYMVLKFYFLMPRILHSFKI